MDDRDDRARGRGPRSPGHRWLVLGAALVPLVMMAVALGLEPDARGYGTHEQLGLPACATRAWFGVPCPACGCTTAVTRLWSGDPLGAFFAQPFGFLLGAGLPLLASWVLWMHVSGRDAARALGRARADRWGRAIAGTIALAWLWKLSTGA